jgi:RNA polymerase-interacting CarD/CdnL/TRCF family regulator
MAYFYNKQGLKTKKLSQSTINQIKQKYPKINFDFNQFKYGIPDNHPNYYSVRNLDPVRIKRKLEIRKTPEYREKRKIQAKKYYTTNHDAIRNTKILCDCGKFISKVSSAAHKKTNRHNKIIQMNNIDAGNNIKAPDVLQ